MKKIAKKCLDAMYSNEEYKHYLRIEHPEIYEARFGYERNIYRLWGMR